MGATVPRTTAPSWDPSVGAVSQTSSSAVLTAERSGSGDGELPATVPSHHEAAPLPPAEGGKVPVSAGPFQTHPEVDRSRGGKNRKDRFSLSGGVRTEDMFRSSSLCLKHGRVTQGAEVSSEQTQNFLMMTGESQQFLELGQSLAS